MEAVGALIDWHMHVWLPEHLGPSFGPGIDRRAPSESKPVSQSGTFDDIDRARREAGISTAVIIGLTSRHLGLHIPNDFVAEYVSRDPKTTIGFASVDPNDPQAIAELRRAVELGLVGLKLSPPYQAFHPHSDEAWAVFEAANELGLPVMFHQGGVFTPKGVLEYANPVLLDRVARSFPDLKIIIAHVGQPWFAETVTVMYKNENVFADLSARFNRPWQLHNILLSALDYGVVDRLLFGSDFPAMSPSFALETFRNVNTRTEGKLPAIPADVIDSILYERPLSLLGLAGH